MKRGGQGKESLSMTVSHVLSNTVPFLIIFSISPLSTILYGFTSKDLTALRVILDSLTRFINVIIQQRFRCRRLAALRSEFHQMPSYIQLLTVLCCTGGLPSWRIRTRNCSRKGNTIYFPGFRWCLTQFECRCLHVVARW